MEKERWERKSERERGVYADILSQQTHIDWQSETSHSLIRAGWPD